MSKPVPKQIFYRPEPPLAFIRQYLKEERHHENVRATPLHDIRTGLCEACGRELPRSDSGKEATR